MHAALGKKKEVRRIVRKHTDRPERKTHVDTGQKKKNHTVTSYTFQKTKREWRGESSPMMGRAKGL
jgi:hypothetical protein